MLCHNLNITKGITPKTQHLKNGGCKEHLKGHHSLFVLLKNADAGANSCFFVMNLCSFYQTALSVSAVKLCQSGKAVSVSASFCLWLTRPAGSLIVRWLQLIFSSWLCYSVLTVQLTVLRPS